VSSNYYIRPEELIHEIRKVYPTERFTEIQRPIVPRVSFANEYLYGVPIYVYGEGFKGQYLRHAYFDREGRRYWAIEYGWVSLYGRVVRLGYYIPLVVFGIPTRFIFEFKPQDFDSFKLEEVPYGYLECREDQMINLERVMRGEDPILIIDKYDLIRIGTPSEFIERIKEQQSLIETLQRTLWEYEKNITDYKTNYIILQSRLAKMQELFASFEARLVKLSTEVTSIQNELIRLREEIIVRGAEAQNIEEARKRLRDMVESLGEMLRDITTWAVELRKSLEPIRMERAPPPPPPAPPAPTPTAQQQERKSEKEEEAEAGGEEE